MKLREGTINTLRKEYKGKLASAFGFHKEDPPWGFRETFGPQETVPSALLGRASVHFMAVTQPPLCLCLYTR